VRIDVKYSLHSVRSQAGDKPHEMVFAIDQLQLGSQVTEAIGGPEDSPEKEGNSEHRASHHTKTIG
jgi:hypothetical protein